ncbi:PA2778 family cysteine peptidase [Hydrocarboniclastica marina]|uniref:PA2778 family cysteine peptidase n=1 Tax=Hydrocarboniclastica marina TaxID=2259620 RepID=UPI0015628CD4|nr:PA2778 family cysteine peptidase [Hydrocarboniclastica marina]
MVAALLGLTGCAGQPRLDSTTLASLPPAQKLSTVPFYPQSDYQCGPASLAMVLNYSGANASPVELRPMVYLPGRQGSLQVEMVAAARQYDLLVYPLEQRLDAILQEVNGGNPVLVLQNLGLDWWPMWHFAVVIGYDLPARELILHSGLKAEKRESFSSFTNTWERGGRWARVILPPDKLPETARPLVYVRAAHDLELTGRSNAARVAYATASSTWPDNTAAAFAQANLALSQGEYSEAAHGFRGLLERKPEYSPAWNNLAIALEQLDCNDAASQARACTAKAAAPESRDHPGKARPPKSQLTESSREKKCSVPACPTAY